MQKIKAIFEKNREAILYIFFGGATTLISFLSYSVVFLLMGVIGADRIELFKVSLSVIVANILSWVFAVAFAFITNKVWVFNSKSFDKKVLLPEIIKFVSSRILTGVLEIVLVPLLIVLGLDGAPFNIEGLYAKILVTIIVIVLNYVLSKLLIFNKKSSGEN